MPKVAAEKLQEELAKNKVAPVYLLTGEDTYRKQEIIQKRIFGISSLIWYSHKNKTEKENNVHKKNSNYHFIKIFICFTINCL